MDIRNTQLHPDKYYHIFNRGINGMSIFFEDKNYDYFLRQFSKYVEPFTNNLAFCLLKNHFHLMIKVKSENDLKKVINRNEKKPLTWHISNGFSSFFQGYTRAINKAYNRTGPLFESPFKRIEVDNNAYFTSLIAYIHQNPKKHGILKDFQDYTYSSYNSFLNENYSSDAKHEVLSWYGGKDQFIRFHEDNSLIQVNKDLLLESD